MKKNNKEKHPLFYIPNGYVVSDDSGLEFTVADKKKAVRPDGSTEYMIVIQNPDKSQKWAVNYIKFKQMFEKSKKGKKSD